MTRSAIRKHCLNGVPNHLVYSEFQNSVEIIMINTAKIVIDTRKIKILRKVVKDDVDFSITAPITFDAPMATFFVERFAVCLLIDEMSLAIISCGMFIKVA